jgi:general secretion pathway protein A
MYWEHFRFNEPPFALTPNPAFLFLSAPHQEAFAHLLFAIEHRVGFIELSGEVGAGKTTLVRTLLNQLDPELYRTALVFNPTLSPLGLLKEVNGELGIPRDATELCDLHQALNHFLLEENRGGRTVVLVIDEAQNLSVEVLEQIRLISNLETDSDKLIQIVLVGQPELNQLLARPELRQLDQRITVRYHLKPMCLADTGEYIRHRIRFAADGREPLKFTAGAVKQIFRFSGGLPRLINGACDRALLLAYTRDSNQVSPSMALSAITDVARERRNPRRTLLMGALGAALVLAAFAATWRSLPDRTATQARTYAQRAERRTAPTASTQTALTVPAPAPGRQADSLSRQLLLKKLGSASEQESLFAAVNAVLAVWHAPGLAPVPGRVEDLPSLARLRGFTATKVQGNLDALARLDSPALLHLNLPGVGSRVVALTGLGKESVTIAPAIEGRSELSRADLAMIWNGGATVLWKDFHSLAARSKAPDRERVKLLQGLLREVGCYQGPLNGKPGPKTQAALSEFQRREQVVANGEVTAETLLHLYRRAGGYFPPTLSQGKQAKQPEQTESHV